MTSHFDAIGPLRRYARAQCSNELLAAAAQCEFELKPAEAQQLIERYQADLGQERLYGQAKVLLSQFELATEHSLTPQGNAMLVHIGAQHLGQQPGGPDRELQKLLRRLKSMGPAQQAQALRTALSRLGVAA